MDNTKQSQPAAENAAEYSNSSAFVIAYALAGFSGFLMGLFAGWVIWAKP